MELIPYVEFVLPLIFFIVAFVYSSVGLGGGSSYTALMAIVGMSILVVPMMSLLLNLFVSTLGAYNFLRNKHGKLSIILPFLISAVPFAYLGGTLHLSKTVFLWVLLISLIVVAVRIYFWKDASFRLDLNRQKKIIISLIFGSILGLVAGIVGIGGGIYLIPIVIMFRIGSPKEAAATAAIFVWSVSFSGLVSRLQYNSIDLTQYVPLITAVIIGGFWGSYMGSFRLSPKAMEKILGLIILMAIVFLFKKLLS